MLAFSPKALAAAAISMNLSSAVLACLQVNGQLWTGGGYIATYDNGVQTCYGHIASGDNDLRMFLSGEDSPLFFTMTGRQRFNCISAKSERKMGTKEYQQLLSDLQGKVLPENHPLTVQVNRVLHRLIPNAPLEGADWKVHVINEPNEVNAFVLPGGKVFVFTGILPVCQDDNGLAAVLGHEIAHVVAHHPAERMSHNAISMVLALVTALILDISGQLSSMLLSLAYGLPNSRIQEAEADEMGLMIMSKSCFNPEGAVNLNIPASVHVNSSFGKICFALQNLSYNVLTRDKSITTVWKLFVQVPAFEKAFGNYRW
ncbi:M48 family metallopeptidase [Aspergillus tanneri]|uniref:Peptidase M48 domain-containing protein n=1 Tax=Aspergillus tanneri TaxID=1220188 RepID=A0A5M9MPC9_9EURO|nr:uncharacterized protein ATNIH1004_004761 [Aspergillus tanneri]KAA8648875.1 hypothetical protein ATNIH1004_004761 [Aspergillus tanneri]